MTISYTSMSSKSNRNTIIYVLSTEERASKNKYFVARHTGSEMQLITRFTSNMGDPVKIYFTIAVAECDLVEIDNMIRYSFKDNAVVRSDGTRMKWIKYDLEKIIKRIKSIIKKYYNDIVNNPF